MRARSPGRPAGRVPQATEHLHSILLLRPPHSPNSQSLLDVPKSLCFFPSDFEFRGENILADVYILLILQFYDSCSKTHFQE